MDQPNPSLSGVKRVVQPSRQRLQVEGLWHRFGGNGAPWVLEEIDLQLQERELVGLLGPSGCGKTSLLRLIIGFDRPCRGRVLLDGQEVSSPTWLRPPERRNIGMVFQDDALFPHLSVWDNACFGMGPGRDRSRASWLLELVGLEGLEERYPHELSGGQRQRL
ncbi:MAG: ATP-binding cassette domain-containing protein, partial [Synechococcus sp. SB0664_bin_36]|nr:ATP-binding cassette domain-containing protein [Synechococcus sp. SB0664_bin_36]